MSNMKKFLEAAKQQSDGSVTGDVMKKAMELAQQRQAEKMTDQVVDLLNRVEARIQNTVTELRNVRKQESNLKKHLEQIDKASSYFEDTGNPLPLLLALNTTTFGVRRDYAARAMAEAGCLDLPDDDDPRWKIPSDWNPEK